MSSERGVIPLSAKLTKMPNTLKQFVGNLSTNCLSVFGHFIKTAICKFCCFPQIVYCSTENANVKVFQALQFMLVIQKNIINVLGVIHLVRT